MLPLGLARACLALLVTSPRHGVASYVAASHASLGAAFAAPQGYVNVVRRSVPPEGDPLRGFRVEQTYLLGPSGVRVKDWIEDAVAGSQAVLLADPILRRIMADAGRHRVHHDPDPRTDPALAHTIDAHLWSEKGLVDRLKVTHAYDEDRELHIGFDRHAGEAPFGAEDVAAAEAMVELLGEWTRRLFFLHGLLPGQVALTSRERDVVAGLLGPEPVKQVADAHGISEARARELVRAVYEKLGVRGRTELASAFFDAEDARTGAVVTAPVKRRRGRGPAGGLK